MYRLFQTFKHTGTRGYPKNGGYAKGAVVMFKHTGTRGYPSKSITTYTDRVEFKHTGTRGYPTLADNRAVIIGAV